MDRSNARRTVRTLGPILACATLIGCPTSEVRDDPRVRTVLLQHAVIPVLAADDSRSGVAAVVRVTPDWVVAIARLPETASEPLRLALGDERVPVRLARVGELAVLTAARAGRDLRPVHRGVPEIGKAALVISAGPGLSLTAWGSEVLGVREDRLVLGRATPFAPGLVAHLPRALALTANGGILGVVSRVTDAGLLVVTPLPPFAALDAQVLALGGADMLRADDGFLSYDLSLSQNLGPAQVPLIEDDWGEPDLFVALEVEQRGRQVSVGRVALSPGQEQLSTMILLQDRRPITARLVERDVDLVDGESLEELASPLTIRSYAPRLTLPFQLTAETFERHPRAANGPRSVRIDLRLDPLDPDRASGPDRTPLGATAQKLRRVGVGSVDLVGGDATDFWSFQVADRGPLLLFLSRQDAQAGVVVEGFRPPAMEPLFRLAAKPDDERRLVMELLNPDPGPILVRVRQLLPRKKSNYGLLAFPRDPDPRSLVRALFGLVSREASRSRAHFLGSVGFASDLAVTLLRQANFDPTALSLAVLESLGQRTRIPEARHLALNLLELHMQPPLIALEAARRQKPGPGARGVNTRSNDAGLLLALRCRNVRTYLPVYLSEGKAPDPDEEPTALTPSERMRKRAEAREVLFKVVTDAAQDPDPRIRLRALGSAANITDRDLFVRLRDALRKSLREDTAPMVQRALESAFPRPLRRQPRRPKRRF